MPVDRVTGGQVVASEWGNQVSDAVAAIEARLAALEAQKPTMGLLPSAFPMGFSPEDASDAVHDIPVLVGALAGAIAVPIIVEASLRLEAYAVRVGKGAPSGEHVQAEIHLYYDVGTTILQEIPGSGDYFDTYLSGADANLNSNGAVALDLAPGAYWCAVRNIRADTIFPVRYRG